MNYKMKRAKKGGAKPDYLDMDGDGNKKESMKSAIASKNKIRNGGMSGSKIKGTGTLTNVDSKGNVIGATKAMGKKEKKDGGVKDTRRTRMRALKKSQREARKELRQGQRLARKEQRGQEREERKEIRAEKRAIRKAKRTAKKVIKKFEKNLKKGPAKVMGGGGTRRHQMGGFLEMPTFDLDRDSI